MELTLTVHGVLDSANLGTEKGIIKNSFGQMFLTLLCEKVEK